VGFTKLKDVDENNSFETSLYGEFDTSGNPIDD